MVNEKDLPKLHLCAWQDKPNLFNKYMSDGPNVTDRFNRYRKSLSFFLLLNLILPNRVYYCSVNESLCFSTPLHLACARGNLESVRELIKGGASTSLADANSRTPLMKVCL